MVAAVGAIFLSGPPPAVLQHAGMPPHGEKWEQYFPVRSRDLFTAGADFEIRSASAGRGCFNETRRLIAWRVVLANS
jgi:hypothetical protein